ncbi:MAG: AI-2E family transporter [Ruminococcaceae bacterium]|nr:AI-2E family transporter [Oscillospiraceae bacterium]
MDIDRRKRFLINVAVVAVGFALWFIVLKLLSGVLLPFSLAILVVVALKGVTDAVCRCLHLKRKPVAVLVVLAFYILVSGLLFLIIFAAFKQLDSVVASLPQFLNKVTEVWNSLSFKINSALGNVSGSNGTFQGIPQVALESLTENLTSFLASFAGTLAAGVPTFLLSLIVTVVASAYFAADYDDIRKLFIDNLSKTGLSRIIELKDVCFGNLLKILRSYLIILLITFTELFLGLSLLGSKYALILSIVISLVDILPVLGCGMVLIPWGVVSALNGDIKNAVGLAVLYLIITAVRNFIEPKIVGGKVGVHPLIMLFSVVVGLRLFGGVGVLLVPMTVIVLKNLPWHPKSASDLDN